MPTEMPHFEGAWLHLGRPSQGVSLADSKADVREFDLDDARLPRQTAEIARKLAPPCIARLCTWLALALTAACSSAGAVTVHISQVGDSEFVLYKTGDAAMPLATRWGGAEVGAPQPWRLTQQPSSDGVMIVAIADAEGRCLEAPLAIGAPMRLAPCDGTERQQFRVAGYDMSPSGSPNGLIDPPNLSSLLRRDGFVIRARAVEGCVGVARDERSSPIGVALLACEDAGGWTRYRGAFNR